MSKFYRIALNGTARHVVAQGGEWRLIDGDLFTTWTPGIAIAASEHQPLAPVLPSKIVAIGLNYKDHAAEQNKPLPAEPLMFLKPSTAVIGPGEAIVLPPDAGRIDYESEVAVVIGRRAKAISEAEALDYVFGLTCVNDVTARDLQKRDVQYTRAKGFDTFAPLGPCIAAGLDLRRPIAIEGWVNGERRQASTTAELIFGIPRLLAHISAVMTLLPGDVVLTGTPAGIGPLAAGDRVTVKVEGVGELTNSVVSG
jgi:2-keto-4-pentenoate hydratase/2-oxohepta-3-ene-1,7-dioic acid hydratase in catechol pathway